MIAFRLCWPVFALCWFVPGAPHVISTLINVGRFKLVNGVGLGSGIQATERASSLAECAIMCVQEKLCSTFNFGSGQCALLFGMASCLRANATGYKHGYFLTGKYHGHKKSGKMVL